MNHHTKEHNILDDAIAALHQTTGVELHIVKRDARIAGNRIDALIQMPHAHDELLVEIKKWAPHMNFGALVHQMEHLARLGKTLLVADYINPKMGDKLRAAHIQFLDIAGNAYFNQPPLYIYIKGNKAGLNAPDNQTTKLGKAFQPTGMKVVFGFLKDIGTINAPYREIAEQAQVALGTVSWVIRDLITQGFLLEGVTKGTRKLADFNQLLNKWAEAYPQKLKEKQKIGTFTTDNPEWWKDIKLAKFDAFWGGEVAAALYTNYLNPKNAIVYINKKNITPFMQTARLRKVAPNEQPEILIELVEPFWKDENPIDTELAHPIIVYADLIETADPRNLETANRLREEYLH